jgi:hypothetical protein
MTPATLVVPRAPFDIEEPWTPPAVCSSVSFVSATNAVTPRLETSLHAWFDERCLSLLFRSADDHRLATHLDHDANLYEEDVLEAFLAPRELTDYFELEVNPLGTLFDARITSPDGKRATMHVDRDWRCEGLVAAIRSVPSESERRSIVDTLLRIPFDSLQQPTPRNGERWRGNFFRVDRHPGEGDSYDAWRPTMREPADFHVPAAFGILEFRA